MKKLQGVGTALITPFQKDRSIDWLVLERLIEKQIKAGVSFLVPCGTTGESPTLFLAEHVKVIANTVKSVNGRVPVIAGTGSNSTAEAVHLAKKAKRAGADGILVVSPYYNKPMPAGFRDYYRQVAAVGLPVILYDIPGRTAKGVPTDVILELAREGSIAGIKWASGDVNQLMEIIINKPENFSVLSGDDNLAYLLMMLGGDGVISVVSNLVPAEMTEYITMALAGNMSEAREKHYTLLPLMRAMFLETNPIPVKTALALCFPNFFHPILRSPMSLMEPGNQKKLEGVLEECNLLNHC